MLYTLLLLPPPATLSSPLRAKSLVPTTIDQTKARSRASQICQWKLWNNNTYLRPAGITADWALALVGQLRPTSNNNKQQTIETPAVDIILLVCARAARHLNHKSNRLSTVPFTFQIKLKLKGKYRFLGIWSDRAGSGEWIKYHADRLLSKVALFGAGLAARQGTDWKVHLLLVLRCCLNANGMPDWFLTAEWVCWDGLGGFVWAHRWQIASNKLFRWEIIRKLFHNFYRGCVMDRQTIQIVMKFISKLCWVKTTVSMTFISR